MWPKVQEIFLVLVFSVSTVQSGSEEVDGILDRCLLLIDEYSKEKPSPEPTIEVSVHRGAYIPANMIITLAAQRGSAS